MAATETGVWNLQEVRDKQLASEWTYTDPTIFSLYEWGSNSYGQLGQNQASAQLTGASSPIQIPGDYKKLWPLSNSKSVAVSKNGSDATGYDLWMWGTNQRGGLGINQPTTTARSSPVQVGTDTTWKYVAGSPWARVASKTDGTLWAWGNAGEAGGLGLNDKTNRSSPMQIRTDTTWTGTLNYLGSDSAHAFKTDGTLWTWGENSYGQLGVNTSIDYSSPVQLPGTYSVVNGTATQDAAFMKSGGTLWMVGRNSSGGLGQNNRTSYSSPVQVPGTTWSSATTGYSAGMATKTDGTLWVWGQGLSGMLGLNDEVKRSSPTQLGTGTTWSNTFSVGRTSGAIKTDGTLWVWGASPIGELGLNNTVYRSSPTQVGTDTDWTKLITGSWYATTIAGK